jgi:hypothetical protein
MFLKRAVWVIFFAAWPALAQIQPVTLKLADGGTVVGRIISAKDQFVQVSLDLTGASPIYTNVAWARLSQETLRELSTNRTTAAFALVFLDPPASQRNVRAPKKITIKTPPRMDRPQGGSLLASPVMLVLLLLVYAANIYAGWEIGVFRQWPPAVTALMGAVVPIIGPAIFLAMPTRRPKEEIPEEVPVAAEEIPLVTEEAPQEPVEQQSAQPAAPDVVVYPRGQFTFNRRFFETKFAGFLKMVPGEAERDKVIFIKSARGEYTGHRFAKVEPNEVYLQVRKGAATEDVMIPFSEIFEVQVKPREA